MKISCSQQSLFDAVSKVSRAVSARTTIAALEGILLHAENGRLTLSGYDLEIGITAEIDVSVHSAGKIVMNARLLNDMLRGFAPGTVEISSDDKHLTEIRCGETEYTILGLPADEFPQLPGVVDGKTITLSQKMLKGMIDQTLFAVATVDTRPALTGVKFIFESGLLTMVSLDGFRLAVRKEMVGHSEVESFIVPGKALGEINKMLSDNEEDLVTLSVSKKHIIFRIAEYSVITRLLEGEFLDYKKAIPADHSTELEIDTRSFIECIERTSLIINDRLRSSIRLSIEDGQLIASCSTALGRSSDRVECKKTGNDLVIYFNNRYLLDVLKASECDTVRVLLGGQLSPIRILPPQGDSFLFLVVPVMVKGETGS